ncbi:MAG: hypothetical protein AB8H80_05345 [Planctomycetota bacterium]
MSFRTNVLAACAASLLAGASSAQQFLNTGDYFVGASVRIGQLSASGQVSTDYLPGSATASRMLWDPSQPDSFINSQTDGSSSSTNGSIVRRTFTSPTTFITTLIAGTGTFDGVDDMRWDQNGRDVVILDFSNRLWRVDTVSGSVQPVLNGAAPWGNAVGMAVDLDTGDIYVNDANADLYRVASGSGGASFVRAGVPGGELVIDSSSDKLYYASSTRFGRIDFSNPAAPNEDYFGTLSTLNFGPSLRNIAFDQNGDFALLTSSGAIYTLPNTGAVPVGGQLPTFVGSIAWSINSSSVQPQGLAVVGGTTTPYRLTVETAGVLGAYIEIENAPQGFAFGYLLPSRATILPADTGPFFGLFPDFLTLAILGFNLQPAGLLAHGGSLPPAITLPPLTLLSFAGETWDFVAVSFAADGRFLGRTNLVRVTWN